MFELPDEGIKGVMEMTRRALISEGCVRVFDMLEKKFAKMRFANARLAAYKADLTFAALGAVPEFEQLLQFLVAVYKPCDLV
jgi:hypothetical protein